MRIFYLLGNIIFLEATNDKNEKNVTPIPGKREKRKTLRILF